MKYEPIERNILIEAVQVSNTILTPSTVEAEEYRVLEKGMRVKNVGKGEIVILSPNACPTPIRNTKFYVTSADNILCIVK